MNAMKTSFAPVSVRKQYADGKQSKPVALFLTHYGARQFVRNQLAQQPQPKNFQWVIHNSPPSGA